MSSTHGSYSDEDEDGDTITVCTDEELGALIGFVSTPSLYSLILPSLSQCQWRASQQPQLVAPICIYPKGQFLPKQIFRYVHLSCCSKQTAEHIKIRGKDTG